MTHVLAADWRSILRSSFYVIRWIFIPVNFKRYVNTNDFGFQENGIDQRNVGYNVRFNRDVTSKPKHSSVACNRTLYTSLTVTFTREIGGLCANTTRTSPPRDENAVVTRRLPAVRRPHAAHYQN